MPGCKVSATNGFAVCDVASGYVKPSTVLASTPLDPYGGKCIPVAYVKNKDTDGATTPTNYDKCWFSAVADPT